MMEWWAAALLVSAPVQESSAPSPPTTDAGPPSQAAPAVEPKALQPAAPTESDGSPVQIGPAKPDEIPAPLATALETQQDVSGDVVVQARDNREDPMSAMNVEVFKVGEDLDKAIIGPAAKTYEKKVPGPLRSGLRNFLNNLREPVVFANFLLQLKIGKAAETAARFGINSTVGLAGVMDIAKRKPFRLPLRRNSFSNTLGYYGVKPGLFFFLPLIGPTTVRDLIGSVLDQVFIPIQPIRPSGGLAYTAPIGVLSALDYRVRIDPDLQRQRETGDSYTALRKEYLARRQAEIDLLRGRRPDLRLPTADDSPGSILRPRLEQSPPLP